MKSEERNCLGDNDERSFGHMAFELSLAYPVKRFSGQGAVGCEGQELKRTLGHKKERSSAWSCLQAMVVIKVVKGQCVEGAKQKARDRTFGVHPF